MNVILGITGGIAAYKACDLINILKSNGYDVRVIMTQHAKEFITPLTLSMLSNHPVMDDMWSERNGNVEHIDVAKWCNIFVVYPSTVNIIGKFANGIADDLLSTVYLALPDKVQKFIFPAANTCMIESLPVKKNLQTLLSYGVFVTGTREAHLACGDLGKGAVLKPKEAVEIIKTGVPQ
jgi:phosphopantothenoylcysteine decarboxylase/phosphopantothenate--cysteine ligase